MHDNAFGASIKIDSLETFLQRSNEDLKDYNFGENVYDVNLVRTAVDRDIEAIVYDIDKYYKLWGQNCNEPLIFVGDINITKNDVNNITNFFKPDTFDVVTCNPPYFKTNNTLFENNNIIKASARHEKLLTLEDILRVSKYLLKNNGRLAMVHRTERLMEILFLMKKYNIEPKKIRFVYPNNTKNSDLVLIEGTLNGKSGLKIMNPLFVYVKKDVYSKEVKDMFGE